MSFISLNDFKNVSKRQGLFLFLLLALASAGKVTPFMNSSMNSLPLRKLIRKYGNLGYLVAGCWLLGCWLFQVKRRQMTAAIALALLAGSGAFWLNMRQKPFTDMECTLIGRDAETARTDAASYTVTDLGVISGYDYSFGQKINAKGQTTGFVADDEFEKVHGFFCTSNGKMSDIGTLGGDISVTTGLNDDGQIVGSSLTERDETRGFVWQNGKITRIGTLGGEFSLANGVNNKGQVVGLSDTRQGLPHAYLWQNGDMKDISGKCPGRFNSATAINDSSDVAGVYTDDGDTLPGFVLSSGGKSKTLPSLGGSVTFPTSLSKKAVVGFGSLSGDEVLHGFFTTTRGVQDIGTLGGEFSFAEGVNEKGQAVGSAETKDEMLHAVLWQNGKLTDLNTLLPSGSGWELILADGINDRGQIIGTGIVGNTIHAFVLTPKG